MYRYVIFLFLFACTTPDMMGSSAESNATVYARKLGLPATGVACSNSDSDLDGYVSCTVALESGDRVPIECNYDKAFAPLGQQTGCKSVVVVGNGFQAQPATQ